MTSVIARGIPLLVCVLLAACGARSPDLPLPRLVQGPVVSCVPQGPLSIGQTSQCTITQCIYEVVHADGSVTTEPHQCPAANWSTAPGSVASIDNNGRLTATSAGTVTVTAAVDGGSGSTTVVVVSACVQSLSVTPATAQVIAGLAQAYTATATFSDNHAGDVTGQTAWSSSNTNVATVGSDGVALTSSAVSATTPVTITGSYSGANICSGVSSPLSGSGVLTVVPGHLLAVQGLCIEPVNGAATLFNGCRADSGVCASTATPLNLAVAQQGQFRLRARYDNGQECNVSTQPATVWGSSAPAIATVSNTGLATGVAAGSANATASFQGAAAAPYPILVGVGQVLGRNSLRVAAAPYTAAETPRKFACVGATDIVGALADSSQIQGRRKLFAGVRYCAASQRDAQGNCSGFIGSNVGDVTNDDGVSSLTPAANRMLWTQASSYWDGAACVSTLPAAPPVGGGPSGLVGDTFTPSARYALGDRRPGENGVVVGAGAARVGFSCITAQYTNPGLATNTVSDGMTVLVLPVTNDVLLGPSSANDATHLCDALEPLFQLAASANGGDGALTQLLSAVTEIVNPVLQSVADGTEPGNAGPLPVTSIVNQVTIGLSDAATAQIFAAGLGPAVAAIDTGVYAPAICGLRALLIALTAQNPGAAAAAQACFSTP